MSIEKQKKRFGRESSKKQRAFDFILHAIDDLEIAHKNLEKKSDTSRIELIIESLNSIANKL